MTDYREVEVHEIDVFASSVTATVRRSAPRDWSGEYAEVEVHLPNSGRRTSIECTGPYPGPGGVDVMPARVNWPSIGSVSVTDAVTFAGLVSMAATIAEQLAPSLVLQRRAEAGS